MIFRIGGNNNCLNIIFQGESHAAKTDLFTHTLDSFKYSHWTYDIATFNFVSIVSNIKDTQGLRRSYLKQPGFVRITRDEISK